MIDDGAITRNYELAAGDVHQSHSNCLSASAPKVSVAIITYNQCDFLRVRIEPGAAQDYPLVEIVVADDGSSDGTREFLNQLHRRSRDLVTLSLTPHNRGITRNSNAALTACTGRKYIAWVGGDDLMLAGELRKQVEYLETHPDCGICYHDLEVFGSATGQSIRRFNRGPGSLLPHGGGAETLVEFGTFVGACSAMVRRSSCPRHGFDERIPITSDWLFWIETAMQGRVAYLDEVLGRYRRHSANVTSASHDCSEQVITLGIVEAKYPVLARYCQRNRPARLRAAAIQAAEADDPQRVLEYLGASIGNGEPSAGVVKLWARCLLQTYTPGILARLDRLNGRT